MLFFPDENFVQKIIHNYIWAPNIYVSQKINELIPRKFTDRQKDGPKDGRKDPILWDLPAKVGGLIRIIVLLLITIMTIMMIII